MEKPQEIINRFNSWIEEGYEEEVVSISDAIKAMQEYAQQCCKEQRRICSDSAELKYLHYPYSVDCVVDEDSILNCALAICI